VNVKRLTRLSGLDEEAYKNVGLNDGLFQDLCAHNEGKRVFFRDGVAEDYIDHSIDLKKFRNFEEAYHQLMIDLIDLTVSSINLITGEDDSTRNIYITGGFSKNPIFLKGIARQYSEKNVCTSDIPNATSLGAALVLWKALEPGTETEIDLGLKICSP
jgi:ribulose kinase